MQDHSTDSGTDHHDTHSESEDNPSTERNRRLVMLHFILIRLCRGQIFFLVYNKHYFQFLGGFEFGWIFFVSIMYSTGI